MTTTNPTTDPDTLIWQALTRAPRDVVMQRVAPPTVGPGQLGVDVRRIGICGSDLHVYLGHHPYTRYPVVQGHEVAGVVNEVGPGVPGFKVGDRVALQPQLTCGTCAMCRSDREHICESLRVMGFQAPGAGQERVTIDPRQAVLLPASMDLDLAALVEPVAVAAHALGRVGRPFHHVLVLGAGPIGNLVGQVAASTGAEVLITDLTRKKLEVAAAAGLTTIDAASEDVALAVARAFPEGPDVIAECVGSEATMSTAIAMPPRGATILVVGVFGSPATIDVGLIQDRELRVFGSLMYRREDYERAVDLLAGGQIDTSGLITHRYRFEELPSAYREIVARREDVIKAMVTLAD